MAVLCHNGQAERCWVKAAGGNREALRQAFIWRSTEEGFSFWCEEAEKTSPMPPELIERIGLLYVEWKLLGDTDVREKDARKEA
jgi:hypothetical protein